MLRALKEYVAAIGADVVSRISGICSVLLLIIAGFMKLSETGQARYWLYAAVVCYAIAAFNLWYKNRPNLIIELREVLLDTNYGGMLYQSNSPLPHFVTFTIYISNTRPADNSIKSYELFVNVYGRQVVGESFWTHGLTRERTWQAYPDLNKTKMSVLKQGNPTEGWLRFKFDGEPSIKGHKFVLAITDAYNVTHKVKGTIPLELTEGLIRRPPDAAFHV